MAGVTEQRLLEVGVTGAWVPVVGVMEQDLLVVGVTGAGAPCGWSNWSRGSSWLV